jgi:hypothetical protein
VTRNWQEKRERIGRVFGSAENLNAALEIPTRTVSKIELAAAEMIERLLAERLALEARNVLVMLLPHVDESSSAILRQKVLAKLPTPDDE